MSNLNNIYNRQLRGSVGNGVNRFFFSNLWNKFKPCLLKSFVLKFKRLACLNCFLQVLLFAFACTLTQSCNKNQPTCGEYAPDVPYTNPVWHPSGTFLGFNRKPLKSIFNDASLCGGYSYSYYDDSIGYWFINKDDSNLRRVLNYQLLNPSWSPDGKWIAFCNGGNIYKMSFDGINFDTTSLINLTTNGASNFFPAWNANGDTIYYDSNKATPPGGSFYAIWKMAADGSGQTLITKDLQAGGREPFFKSTDEILFISFVNQQEQVFAMDTNGDNIRQITSNLNAANRSEKQFPQAYNGNIFFEDGGVWKISDHGSNLLQLNDSSVEGFSISKNGEIAWVNYNFGNIDKIQGTLWLMNSDGTNKKQITFNNY